jgi:hypothetical protein
MMEREILKLLWDQPHTNSSLLKKIRSESSRKDKFRLWMALANLQRWGFVVRKTGEIKITAAGRRFFAEGVDTGTNHL